MLEYNLLPTSGQTIKMVGLFGLGGIVKRPLQPTIFRSAVTPLVTAAIVAVFIEESYLTCSEGILVILIVCYLFHKIGIGIFVVAQQRKVPPT